MALLGKFVKQPDERESYSVQFIQALSPSDEISAGRVLLVRGKEGTRKIKLPNGGVVTELDSGASVIAGGPIELPDMPALGTTYFVSNSSPDVIDVMSFGGLQPQEAVVLTYSETGYVEEATARSVVVNSQADKRMRVFVSGGVAGQSYKAEVTISTAEGRILQDEFIVKIKDF